MSSILLWWLIPAFPHHFLSPERNVIAVLVPSYAVSYLSLLWGHLASPAARLSIFFIYPPFPGRLWSLLSQLAPLTAPSSVSALAVQLIWGGSLVCVCLKCVFVRLSGLWLIRRLTVILWDRPVLLWWFAGLTHPILHIYTRMHFNKPLCTRIYMHSIGHSHTGGFANIVVHI